MRNFFSALVFIVGLTTTAFFVESDQPYLAGGVLFFTLIVLYTMTSEIKGRTIPGIASALIFISGLITILFFLNENHPYWASSVLFLTLIGTLAVSDKLTRRATSIPYTVSALISVSNLVAFVFLLDLNYPYWAGVVLFLTLLGPVKVSNQFAYKTTTNPYIVFALIFNTGLIVITHLVQEDRTYWAAGVLFLIFILVSVSFVEFSKKDGTFYPAGSLIFIGGLASSAYLVNQNHPYWAGILILIALLLFGAGIPKMEHQSL